MVQRLSLDELHGQEVDAVGFLDREHADNAGVVEGGERSGLALESVEPLRVGRHFCRQGLERDVAPELRVGRAVDLAHPARADRGGDPVVAKSASDHESDSTPQPEQDQTTSRRRKACFPWSGTLPLREADAVATVSRRVSFETGGRRK